VTEAQAGAAEQCECALLFLPLPEQNLFEFMLDVLQNGLPILARNLADVFSAQHGYAHVAVDCCGVRDNATPIPTEPTCNVDMGDRFAIHVTRKCHGIGLKAIGPQALTSWDNHIPEPVPYGRLPLSQLAALGVNCETFCQRVNQLVSRRPNYSELRYFSIGFLSDEDAVCTDVVTQCLELELQQRIHETLNMNYPMLIPTLANEDLMEGTYLISPNGFAIALGLPHGKEITSSNQPLTADLRLFDL
jgi:hypothetical protein